MPVEYPSPGDEQEENMRRLLVNEGYQQVFGTSDAEIRRNLNISGPCADFVGYTASLDQWIVAESKGSNLWSAEMQITNTLAALLAKEPRVSGKVELCIYTNALQYARLSQEPHGTGGYYRQGDLLGSKPAGINFEYAEVLGSRVYSFYESGYGEQS